MLGWLIIQFLDGIFHSFSFTLALWLVCVIPFLILNGHSIQCSYYYVNARTINYPVDVRELRKTIERASAVRTHNINIVYLMCYAAKQTFQNDE